MHAQLYIFVVLSSMCLFVRAIHKYSHVGRAHDIDDIAATLGDNDGLYDDIIDDDYARAALDQEVFLGRARVKDFEGMSPDEAKAELRKLIKIIDTNHDNMVSVHELAQWIESIDDNYFKKDSKKQFASTDADKDGFISLDEYHVSMGLDDSMTPKDEEVRRVKEEEFDSDANKFHGADKDDDGKLNKEEFPTFLDPEHHDMANHLAEEFLQHHDTDHDDAISVGEYMGVFTEHFTDSEPDWLKEERKNFLEKFDKNGDGKLDKDELNAWNAPENSKSLYAIEEAEYLLSEADIDKDKQLTEAEIMDNYHVFVISGVVESFMMRDEL